MAYQYILFERSEGVGLVTLNRPDQLNALTLTMLQELSDVFRGMQRDPQVRAILITGAGRAFCGGEDLRQRAEAELGSSAAPSSPAFEPYATPGSTSFGNPGASPSWESGGPSPYQPSSQSSQPGPQPVLAAEFAPLAPSSAPIENPRTAFAGIPQPLETRSGPLFQPVDAAEPPLPMPVSTAPGAAVTMSEQVRRAYNPFIKQIRQMEKPIIAAVNGVAAGTGLGLALACDIRYAAERARFVEVSVRVGLLPGSGTAYFLPRLIGLSKALELAFAGDELNASEAERLGLVSRVLPGDKLLEESRRLAERLAKGPTRAIGLTKSLIYKSANLNLDQSLDLEAQLTEEAVRSQDYKEGLQAFVEKRAPQYKGQ